MRKQNKEKPKTKEKPSNHQNQTYKITQTELADNELADNPRFRL